MDRTDSQLEALGVVHYVVAGFVSLFGLLPLIHVAMGVGIITGKFPFAGAHPLPPDFPSAFGWFFVAMGIGVICLAQAMAVVLVLAGNHLRHRRRWLFCVIVDAIACSLFPFGTVLGVLTLVTLSQPEVKARFT